MVSSIYLGSDGSTGVADFRFPLDAKDVSVPDGDNITKAHLDMGLDLAGFKDQDLGDHVEVRNGRLYRTKRSIRLANIDAPEMKGSTKRERAMAVKARDYLQGAIGEGETSIVSHTKPDKFGRFLATAFVDARDINKELLDAGLVRQYSGGKKPRW